jgi:hypothetical protein
MTELQAKLASLFIFKELDTAELALLTERLQWFSVMGREQRIFSSYPIVRKVVPRESSELLVGPSTLGAVLGQKIVPGWLDFYLGCTGYASQETSERIDPGCRADESFRAGKR